MVYLSKLRFVKSYFELFNVLKSFEETPYRKLKGGIVLKEIF